MGSGDTNREIQFIKGPNLEEEMNAEEQEKDMLEDVEEMNISTKKRWDYYTP